MVTNALNFAFSVPPPASLLPRSPLVSSGRLRVTRMSPTLLSPPGIAVSAISTWTSSLTAPPRWPASLPSTPGGMATQLFFQTTNARFGGMGLAIPLVAPSNSPLLNLGRPWPQCGSLPTGPP